jgi:hypothetical protein
MTAVDFIVQKLNPLVNAMPNDIYSTICNIIIEAKTMEKKQIIDAHLFGLLRPLEMEATKQAEQYYSETYVD